MVSLIKHVKHFVPLLVPDDFLVSHVLASDRVLLVVQVLGLDIDSKQTHRLDTSFYCYSVYLTTD